MFIDSPKDAFYIYESVFEELILIEITPFDNHNSLVTIQGLSELVQQKNDFKSFDVKNTGYIFYSASEDFEKLYLEDFTLDCGQEEGIPQTATDPTEFNSVFQINLPKAIISNRTTVKNCYNGKYGIFQTYKVQEFIDIDSNYENITAQNGGVYYLQGDSYFYVTSNTTIYNCTYNNIHALVGGVIGLIDQVVNVTVQDCSFTNNGAQSGGVFYVFETASNIKPSALYVLDCYFYGNTASNKGGAFYIQHYEMSIQVNNSYFLEQSAPTGGTFAIEGISDLLLFQDEMLQSSGNEGSIIYSTSSNAYFFITECIFKNKYNYTDMLELIEVADFKLQNSIYFSSQLKTTFIESLRNEYSNFYGNYQGGVYMLRSVNFIEEESVYSNNSAVYGGVIGCSSCNLYSISNLYEYNFGYEGGVIYAESEANVTLQFETYKLNTAISQGGAVYITTRTFFYIYSVKFFENRAQDDSAIYASKTSTTINFTISYCHFEENQANSGTVSFRDAAGTLQLSSFIDNEASLLSENVFITDSIVLIYNCKFLETQKRESLGSKQTTGNFIFISLNSYVDISNSTFTNGAATQGGAIYLNGLSQLKISYSTFKDNYSSNSGGAIYLTGNDQVEISYSQFQRNKAKNFGSEIYSFYSSQYLIVNHTKFQQISNSSSIYCDSISLQVNNSNWTENFGRSFHGGGIVCINCDAFSVNNSVFNNLHSHRGGAIYVQQLDSEKIQSEKPYYFIENSNFTNNSAYYGGGVYIDMPEYLQMKDNNFYFNKAYNYSNIETSGYGGGMYYTCFTNANCKVLVLGNNSFINNSADNAGGGVKWDDLEPKGDFHFFNNTAVRYANDIGSFPQMLMPIEEEDFITQIKGEIQTQRRILQESTNIQSQRSGGYLPPVYLALADKYNNIVGNYNGKKLNLRIDTNYQNGGEEQYDYPPFLEGELQFNSNSGVFNVSNIIIAGSPGYSFKILVETDGIDQTKESNKEYYQSLDTNSSVIDFPLEVELRECEVGEQFMDSGKCEDCSPGTEYLIELQFEPGICRTCPEQAICYGGAKMGPKPGYWRLNNQSDDFIQCINQAACLGTLPPDYNPKGECAQYYKGVVCGDCDEGFSRNGNYQCSKCPPPAKNTIRLIGIFIAAIFVIVFMIRSTLKGAKERKNVTSIYTKILMNHLQLLLLTASFEFQWPEVVQQFFTASKPISQVGESIFSVDCFLGTQKETSLETNYEVFRAYYVKLLLIALLPIILFIGCYGVWGIYSYKIKDYSHLRGRAISSLVILLFLFHPNIVQYMFGCFNCFQIDDETRVYDDLQIECYKGPHVYWSLGVALPALIVWGLGIPLFAYLLLRKERHQLTKIQVKEQYGFLYNGYKIEFYYWEVVIMYRKIIMVVIAVVIANLGVIVQALVVFMLLIMFLILNLKKQPFSQVALNDLETASLITSMLTIYCGLFYIADLPDEAEAIYNNSIQLSEWLKLLFFAVILLTNLFFFSFWVYKYYIELRTMIIKKNEKIYLLLCLCGNKQKLEREKTKIMIAEENELLREDYMKSLDKLRNLYDQGNLILNPKVLEKIQVYLDKDKILKLAGQLPEVSLIKIQKFNSRRERVNKFKTRLESINENYLQNNQMKRKSSLFKPLQDSFTYSNSSQNLVDNDSSTAKLRKSFLIQDEEDFFNSCLPIDEYFDQSQQNSSKDLFQYKNSKTQKYQNKQQLDETTNNEIDQDKTIFDQILERQERKNNKKDEQTSQEKPLDAIFIKRKSRRNNFFKKDTKYLDVVVKRTFRRLSEKIQSFRSNRQNSQNTELRISLESSIGNQYKQPITINKVQKKFNFEENQAYPKNQREDFSIKDSFEFEEEKQDDSITNKGEDMDIREDFTPVTNQLKSLNNQQCQTQKIKSIDLENTQQQVLNFYDQENEILKDHQELENCIDENINENQNIEDGNTENNQNEEELIWEKDKKLGQQSQDKMENEIVNEQYKINNLNDNKYENNSSESSQDYRKENKNISEENKDQSVYSGDAVKIDDSFDFEQNSEESQFQEYEENKNKERRQIIIPDVIDNSVWEQTQQYEDDPDVNDNYNELRKSLTKGVNQFDQMGKEEKEKKDNQLIFNL